MGWEYEPDTVWKAQELYCVDRLSYARVAELTGVSATALKEWGKKFQWAKKREEVAQAESEIRFNTVMGRKAILEHLVQAEDGKTASQAAFAVASLENLALKRAELEAAGKIQTYAEPAAVTPKISNRADAIEALRKAIEGRLGLALADPKNITAALVQDIKRCLELLSDLEASLPKDVNEEKGKALSCENAEALREILGVKNGT